MGAHPRGFVVDDGAVATMPGRGWRFFTDLGVQTKIQTAIGLAAAVAVVVAIVGQLGLHEANTAARRTYTRAGATIEESTLLLEWRF